jgi:predicted DNA-binding transcriptional regulator AlpA
VNVGETDKLLQLKEAAARLGMSVRSVWRRIASGELPRPVYPTSRACLPLSAIDSYIERLKREGRR